MMGQTLKKANDTIDRVFASLLDLVGGSTPGPGQVTTGHPRQRPSVPSRRRPR